MAASGAASLEAALLDFCFFLRALPLFLRRLPPSGVDGSDSVCATPGPTKLGWASITGGISWRRCLTTPPRFALKNEWAGRSGRCPT